METALAITFLAVWIISLLALIVYFVRKDDPQRREQNSFQRYSAYRDEVNTKRSVWQRAGVAPPGKEFSPIGKASWTWILLSMLVAFIWSGFNSIIAIIALFSAGFIAEGMGWKNSD